MHPGKEVLKETLAKNGDPLSCAPFEKCILITVAE